MLRHRLSSTLLLCLFSLVVGLAETADDTEDSPVACRAQSCRWVVDREGRAIGPETFRRGLQTSGLVWSQQTLWSIGDQRGEYPEHLLRIDPLTGRLVGEPIALEISESLESSEDSRTQLDRFRAVSNSDFEGLTTHPRRRSVLFAVVEDKTPLFVEIHLEADSERALSHARITGLTDLVFPSALEPWRDKTNFRLEGLAISADARTVYFAYERSKDDLPRLLSAPLAALRGESSIELDTLPIDWKRVPRRADKARARLNLNDIVWLPVGDHAGLLAVARDQERLLRIDLEEERVVDWFDLDLRDPDGHSILWVSPEGITVDATRGICWVINDPDSVQGNFRRRDHATAEGAYAQYAPLLFEFALGQVLSQPSGKTGVIE